MAFDDFDNLSTSLTSPADRFVSITPNDALDLARATRGIYIGTSGDVRITDAFSNIVTFKNLVAGVVHPIRATGSGPRERRRTWTLSRCIEPGATHERRGS